MQSENPKVQQIIDWVLEHPGSLLPEIEKGTDVVGVASYLTYLTRNGRLVRTGDKNHYRYRVAEESDLLLTQSSGTHGEVMNNDAAGGREVMAQYISVVCPHCGKEAARLRLGESHLVASNHSVESVQLSPEEQAKLKSIKNLDLTVRTLNCLDLIEPEIKTVGDLIQFTKAELLRTKNFGRVCLNEVCATLENMNLSLARYPRLRRWNEQTKTYDIIPNEYGPVED
jgi:hypothetical protein